MASTRARLTNRRKSITVIVLLVVLLLTIIAIAAVIYGIVSRPRTPNWQPLGPASALLATEPQRAATEAQIVFVTAGPLALNARDPYRGCVVAWNSAEQTFVDPCFGSRYRADGSYISGPSPRGLDRFPTREANGIIEIDLNQPISGPAHP